MALQLICDRCGKSEPQANEELRKEWTALALAKVTFPSVPFQKEDLCEECTGELRLWLQQGDVS